MKSHTVFGNNRDSNDDDDVNFKEKIINKSTGKCPETVIKIQGEPVRCLMDSGSEVSTLTESCVKQKLFKKDSDITDTTSWIHIKAANSLDIPYVGYVEFDIEILEQKYADVGFMVVKDPTNETIMKKKMKVPGLIGNLVKHLETTASETCKSQTSVNSSQEY